MVYTGAPLCVSILRFCILSGLVFANPSIVPFIGLTFRSLLFWIVVAITIFFYLKAAFTDPGFLKSCPTAHLETLDLKGGVEITRECDLKVQTLSARAVGLNSDDDDVGIGIRRVRRKQHHTPPSNPVVRAAYEQSYGTVRNDLKRKSSSSAFEARQDNEGKRKKRILSSASRRSGKRVYEAVKQVQDDEVCNMDDSSSNWSDADSDKNDVVIDFAVDSNDEDVLRLSISSNSSSLSSTGLEETAADDHKHIVLNSHQLESQRNANETHTTTATAHHHSSDCALSPISKSANVVELVQLSERPTSSSTTRDNSNIVRDSSTTIFASSRSNESSKSSRHQANVDHADGGEGFYPFSIDDASSDNVWGNAISAAFKHPPEKSNRFSDPNFQSHQHCHNRCSPASSPHSFIKQSLSQIGNAAPNTTTSAAVGATLTYAIAGSVAVPFAVIGVAASQIANTARAVLGVDNEVTKACQSINRSARQLSTKFSSEDAEDDSAAVSLPVVSRNDVEPHVIGTNEVQAIRARPRTFSFDSESPNKQTPSSSVIEPCAIPINTQQSSDSGNILNPRYHPVSTNSPSPSHQSSPSSLACAESQSATSQQKQQLLNPSILRYHRVMTKTSDGRPCQSRIQLRFCRYCKKYQPLRTKHCSECGDCVRTMDHHCPWLGTCVGENNRIWFFWFLVFQSIELTWGMAEVGRTFFETHATLDDDANIPRIIFQNVYLMCTFMIMLFLVIMVLCLVFYHTFLAASNLTTWENICWNQITYLKNLPEKKGSPFNGGVLSNLYVYCCPPSFWSFLRSPFLSYIKVDYGPEHEIIWMHGEQGSAMPCCDEGCCCCGCGGEGSEC